MPQSPPAAGKCFITRLLLYLCQRYFLAYISDSLGIPAAPSPNGEAHEGASQPVPYMIAPEGYYQYFYPGFPPPMAGAPAPGPAPTPNNANNDHSQASNGSNASSNGGTSSTASPTPTPSVPAPTSAGNTTQPPATAHPSLTQAPPYYHQVYPPPFHYAAPGMGYPQPYPILAPPHTVDPSKTTQDQSASAATHTNPPATPNSEPNGNGTASGKSKKRGHVSSTANSDGPPKSKRTRTANAEQDQPETNGH